MTEQFQHTRTYNLLPDKPAAEDRFGGEGHQRSAKALAAAIKKLKNEDGAIGIEGDWGSGKSSVVHFAERILQNQTGSEKYKVFTFDLWAHGMHDIRRPLLEEIVSWSDRECLLPKRGKNKEYFKNKISDRTETVTRNFSRKYSLAGIVALFLAPVIPIALMWLSPFALRGWAPNPLEQESSIFTWIHDLVPWLWAASVAIFIILYINFIIQALRKGISSALSIYESKSSVETENRNIQRRDPATTEFHRIFREILSEIQSKDRRLVLVLDNIDRIAEGRLAETWAEVRSVFAANEPGAETPTDKRAVTCLVPYDLEYVAGNLTKSEKGKDYAGQSGMNAAEALVRKTFKAIIRVSPPIAADWEQYFYDRLNEAIEPNIETGQKYRLFKIYEIERRDLGHPTPRDIITYVNEIVLHAEQWQDRIPLEAISLYLACRSRLVKRRQAIIDNDLVSDYAVGVSNLGSDWRKFVAALFYNVDPDHSEKVMLEYRLNDALIGRPVPDFSVMSTLPNFGSLLSDVVTKEARGWAKISVEIFDRAATRIGELSLADYQSAAIWRELAKVLPGMSEVFTDAYGEFKGLQLIVTRQSSHQQVISAGISLISKYKAYVDREDGTEEWEGAYWFEGVESVLAEVESAHSREVALEIAGRIAFPNNVGAAIEACKQVGASVDPKWPLSVFNNAPKAPVHAETFKGWFSKEPSAVFHVIRAKPPFVTKQLLVDAAQAMLERLRTEKLMEKNARKEVVAALIEAVAQLPHLNLIRQQVPEFLDQGFAVWHAGAAIESDDKETAGKLVWFAAYYRNGDLDLPSPAEVPALGPIGNRGQAYNEKIANRESANTFARTIGELSQRTNQFASWQSHALSDPSNPTKIAVYETLIDSELYGGFDSYSTVVDFAKIEEYLADSLLRRMLNWMGGNCTDPHEKFVGEGALEISPNFIRKAASEKVSGLHKYGEAIDSYLLQLSAPNWRDAIEKESRVLDRLILRIETASFSPKALPFREAIVVHLTDLARGLEINTPSSGTWAEMLKAIEKRSFGPLVNDFCSSLSAAVATSEGVVRVARIVPRIIGAALEGPGSGVIISKIIAPLVHADLEAAAALISSAKVARNAVSKEDRETLVSAVEDMVRGGLAEGDQERLKQLCAGIGVPMPVAAAAEKSAEEAADTEE